MSPTRARRGPPYSTSTRAAKNSRLPRHSLKSCAPRHNTLVTDVDEMLYFRVVARRSS
jgi:hypothetical protein